MWALLARSQPHLQPLPRRVLSSQRADSSLGRVPPLPHLVQPGQRLLNHGLCERRGSRPDAPCHEGVQRGPLVDRPAKDRRGTTRELPDLLASQLPHPGKRIPRVMDQNTLSGPGSYRRVPDTWRRPVHREH
eukprot:2059989-Pyramimonas_sp.AAC.1